MDSNYKYTSRILTGLGYMLANNLQPGKLLRPISDACAMERSELIPYGRRRRALQRTWALSVWPLRIVSGN